MTKQEQRKHIKDILKGESFEALHFASELASERVCTLPQFCEANTILAYMAMKRECNPALIVKAAREMGIAVAFPLCTEGNRLKICVPFDETAFVTGAYGIIEPDINKSALLSPNDIDLIIVPGLGFDAEKRRLGRGAGYYDRLLAETRAYKIGFCFEKQIFDAVTVDEHDIRMDCVVTDKRVIQ